jgi:hypothetical protein
MQMADKIVLRSVESLIPYARNARTHSDAQVAQIAGSIREFGFTWSEPGGRRRQSSNPEGGLPQSRGEGRRGPRGRQPRITELTNP